MIRTIQRRLPPQPRSASLQDGRNQQFGEAAGARAASCEHWPKNPVGGTVHFAKGDIMSRKTSTAALDTFGQRRLPNARRVPRHPASEKPANKKSRQVRGAGILPTREQRAPHDAFPCELHSQASQAQLAILQEDRMHSTNRAATMEIAAAQTREHREVRNFPMDRAHIETLQRWVNSGHDEWCRDPQLVASAAVRQVSPHFPESEFELASRPLEGEPSRVTKAIYTYHSLDGRTTCRITLRRFRWLLPTAGTLRRLIWVPERAEIITRDTFD
jgi:hypothetical protein